MDLVLMKILKSNTHFASLPPVTESENSTKNSVTYSSKHSSKFNGLSVRSRSAWARSAYWPANCLYMTDPFYDLIPLFIPALVPSH